MGGVTKSPYQTPETKEVRLVVTGRILVDSSDYEGAGGGGSVYSPINL